MHPHLLGNRSDIAHEVCKAEANHSKHTPCLLKLSNNAHVVCSVALTCFSNLSLSCRPMVRQTIVYVKARNNPSRSVGSLCYEVLHTLKGASQSLAIILCSICTVNAQSVLISSPLTSVLVPGRLACGCAPSWEPCLLGRNRRRCTRRARWRMCRTQFSAHSSCLTVKDCPFLIIAANKRPRNLDPRSSQRLGEYHGVE